MTLLSSTDLMAMGRHIPTPFTLAISDESGAVEIKIDAVLRLVPGKRLVALSHWKNRAVIVKLFFNRHRWKRTMLRDIAGINLLRQAKIPTPKLLFQTTTLDNKAGLLVIEYLQQGVSLATLFDAAGNEEEKIKKIKKVKKVKKVKIVQLAIKSIANFHQAGLWQKDMHLDNFMLSSGVVYALDGGDIKAKSVPLEADICCKNLALFIAQFPVALDEEWRRLIEQYRKHNPALSDADYAEFPHRIIKARQQRLAAFERKLTRSTTANRCEQNSTVFYIYDRSIHSSALERFIADPDSFIEKSQLLKDGNSSTVAVIQIEGQKFVLKRYNIKGFWHGLSRAFRPSRAHNSWRNASMLKMLGVATAQPYLYLEQRVLWFFRKRAYFLCEYIQADDLAISWRNQAEDIGSEEDVIALFRKLFRVLFDYRISHGDMKATNFLIKEKQLYVLDLDAMTRHKSARNFVKKFAKDLGRFQKNWLGTTLAPGVEKLRREAEKF